MATIEFTAFPRATEGRGASRRMRRTGKAPGIVYGGTAAPQPIELDHNALIHALRNEAFHASILTMKVDGARRRCCCATCRCIRSATRCCTSTSSAIDATRKIHMKVPLHFVNAEQSPAVKTQGAIISHVMTEIDIACLPKDLPEFIEVDLSEPRHRAFAARVRRQAAAGRDASSRIAPAIRSSRPRSCRRPSSRPRKPPPKAKPRGRRLRHRRPKRSPPKRRPRTRGGGKKEARQGRQEEVSAAARGRARGGLMPHDRRCPLRSASSRASAIRAAGTRARATTRASGSPTRSRAKLGARFAHEAKFAARRREGRRRPHRASR